MKKVFKIVGVVLVALIVIGILGNLFGKKDGGASSTSTNTETKTVLVETSTGPDVSPHSSEEATVLTTVSKTEAATTETTSKPDKIVLTGGEVGEYGTPEKLVNGELIKEYIAYRGPAGTYTVTNVGKYMTQVTVYKNGTKVNESGITEQIMGDSKPLMLDVNASGTLTILEDEYISIFEPGIIELIPQ